VSGWLAGEELEKILYDSDKIWRRVIRKEEEWREKLC